MTKKPSFQFYPGDWMKDPSVGMCSPATRGVWMDLLCVMHEQDQCGQITGTVESLARICRCSPDEMRNAVNELADTKAATVTERNGKVTVENRRMRREYESRKSNAFRQKRYRGKEGDGNVTCDVTEKSRSLSSPSSSTSVNTLSADAEKCDIAVTSFEDHHPPPPIPNGHDTQAVERVYAAYPRKVGKQAAAKAIKRALGEIRKGQHLPDDHHDPWPPPDAAAWLLDRVQAFARSPAGQAGKFTPHPATWFNQGRFSDPEGEWQRGSNDPPHVNGDSTSGLVECGPVDANDPRIRDLYTKTG